MLLHIPLRSYKLILFRPCFPGVPFGGALRFPWFLDTKSVDSGTSVNHKAVRVNGAFICLHHNYPLPFCGVLFNLNSPNTPSNGLIFSELRRFAIQKKEDASFGITLPKFNSSPLTNGRLEDDPFLGGKVTFQGRTVKLQLGSLW